MDAEIRILTETGEIKEIKKVTYNPLRLTTKAEREFRKKGNIYNHMNKDRITNKDDDDFSRGMKSVNLSEFEEAKTEALEECTRLVWGLADIDINLIPAVDFRPLANKVEEDDLLGFRRDEIESARKADEAKKN